METSNTPTITLKEGKLSDQVTAAARAEFVVTDSKGRGITLKKPNLLAQFNLVKALGDTAKNSAYMSMISPLTYVIAIDGEATLLPQTPRELDALIQRLDEHGYIAVIEGITANFGGNPESKEGELKNS
jgi:hypothetical protein